MQLLGTPMCAHGANITWGECERLPHTKLPTRMGPTRPTECRRMWWHSKICWLVVKGQVSHIGLSWPLVITLISVGPHDANGPNRGGVVMGRWGCWTRWGRGRDGQSRPSLELKTCHQVQSRYAVVLSYLHGQRSKFREFFKQAEPPIPMRLAETVSNAEDQAKLKKPFLEVRVFSHAV